uniref:Uncharacterized protein n=1 Tax=Cyanothece sp. (strain PCC 7425 / ATCC 29141) TaxID=395961 RepID=B8HYV3_CYAP4
METTSIKLLQTAIYDSPYLLGKSIEWKRAEKVDKKALQRFVPTC